jgi:hypothetical protein
MSDNDTVTQVRESLPDDIDARATELKRRAENRELTDAEKQVAVEDMQEMVDALKPVIWRLTQQLKFSEQFEDSEE